MPQASSRPADVERGFDAVDGDRDLSQPAPDESPLEEFNYGDSSWPLFLMYSEIAQQDDNKAVERREKGADGTLIFTGLFAATVGALLTVSLQDLKPNPQDVSTFYLKNIYQLLGNANVSQIPIQSLATPPAFHPPTYAIWVNSLWFLSLVISLTGATAATLVKQWARRYITVTQLPWFTPDQRARIRAILDNARKSNIVWETGPEPFQLHFSLFLFLAGALIYLFNLDHKTFISVVCWVAIFTIAYASHTLGAIFKPEELYYTPFSPLALRIYLAILYLIYQVFSRIKPLHGLRNGIRGRYRDLRKRYRNGFLEGKVKEVDETASKPSSTFVSLILQRTLLALGDDHTLERFFNAIPGFFDSKLVKGQPLDSHVQISFRQTMDGFLDRTFSSEMVSESVRSGRLITCLNAATAALGWNEVSRVLNEVLNGRWSRALQFIETGHSLRGWDHDKNHSIDQDIRKAVACILARAPRHDDRWIALVKDEFGIPDRVLRDYVTDNDSMSLVILIHITRQFLRPNFPSWGPDVLQSLSDFDIRNSLPELQKDFCALWNEIVQEAQKREIGSTHIHILRAVRHLFVALHQGGNTFLTASNPSTSYDDDILSRPSLYPLCDTSNNHPDLTAYGPVTTMSTDPVPPLQLHDPPYSLSGLSSLESRPIPHTSDNTTTNFMQANINPFRGTALTLCSTSGGSSSQQHVDETEGVPLAIASRSLPTHILGPSINTSAISLTPSAGSIMPRNIDTAHIPGALAPPSSTTARPSVTPRVVIPTIIGSPGIHYDTHGQDPPILMEFPQYPPQSTPSATDIVEKTVRPCDPECDPDGL